MELRVESVSGTEVTCSVVQGGRLTDRKGINLPDSTLNAPSLTEWDRQCAGFAYEKGFDYLALSFPLQIETAAQVAGKVGTMLTFGLPEDYYNKYIDSVRAVTPADIKDMATKHVHEVPVIVVVGKAAKVERQLKDVKALDGAKVIKYDTDLKVIK